MISFYKNSDRILHNMQKKLQFRVQGLKAFININRQFRSQCDDLQNILIFRNISSYILKLSKNKLCCLYVKFYNLFYRVKRKLLSRLIPCSTPIISR